MRKYPFIMIPIILFSSLAFKTVEQDDRYFQIVKSLDVFTTLFKEVNAYYVEEINPTELMKIGIDAMLSSLDPYTDYIPEDDIEDYRTMTTGEYGGIGAVIEKKGGIQYGGHALQERACGALRTFDRGSNLKNKQYSVKWKESL